ncbi:MAG: YesL family protein [Lachnospira sp.]
MNGFGLDGKFFRALTKAGDFIILAVITFVFCLPVVTIGSALTAAFYSGIKLVRDEESYVHKDFWKSFKMNFVEGFLLELVHTVIGFLLYIDLRASAQWGLVQGSQVGVIFIFVVVGVMAIWVAVMLYSFAMLSRYDNKLIVTLKNSLIISIHHLPQTVIMLIATVGLIYFSCIYFTAFIVTIPLILYVDSFIFSSIFKHLEKGNETTEDTKEEEE